MARHSSRRPKRFQPAHSMKCQESHTPRERSTRQPARPAAMWYRSASGEPIAYQRQTSHSSAGPTFTTEEMEASHFRQSPRHAARRSGEFRTRKDNNMLEVSLIREGDRKATLFYLRGFGVEELEVLLRQHGFRPPPKPGNRLAWTRGRGPNRVFARFREINSNSNDELIQYLIRM